MWIYVKNKENDVIRNINFPCDEKKLNEHHEMLGISNNMSSKIVIDSSEDDGELNKLLNGNEYNLTDLNAFFRFFDTLIADEKQVFYSVVEAEKISDIKELINLTFNTGCYDLIDSFDDTNKLAEKIFKNRRKEYYTSELVELDKSKYINEIMSSNKAPKISSYGLVYRNDQEYYKEFVGECYPSIFYDDKPLFLKVQFQDRNEYIFAPFEITELSKMLERLGARDISECDISIEESKVSDVIENIALSKIKDLTEFNNLLSNIYKLGDDIDELNTLTETIDVRNANELSLLVSGVKFIEIYSKVMNEEDYGLYLAKENKIIDLDNTLADFIDFKSYGENMLITQDYAFTDKGMISYTGYNLPLISMLNDKLDMQIEPKDYNEQIKFYMPLEVSTHYYEDDYGYTEVANEAINVDIKEISGCADELNKILDDYASHLPDERGLMEYYGKNDSTNAKVKHLKFEFEERDGILFGVATCEALAPLTRAEENNLTDYIIGQASDGFGEGFEQKELNVNGQLLHISFWSSDWDWELVPEEEMDKIDMGMGGM